MRQYANALTGISFVLVTLTGCENTGSATAPSPAIPPGNSAEESAREACLRAVIAETNNSNASVASSEFSEAGTKVIVVIGPQQAAWQCMAYRDGTTSRPMSLTNEGAL